MATTSAAVRLVPHGSVSIVRRDYPNLGAARIVAAFAVIWIHTPSSAELVPSTALGRFAVPFYLAAAIVLNLQSCAAGKRRSFREYARERTVRLLLPFAAWSVLYLGLKVAKRIMAPDQANDFPGLEAIVLGTAYHLWFLPYLFVVSLAVFALGQRLVSGQSDRGVAALATITGVGAALVPCPITAPHLAAVGFMWLAFPTVCWTVAGVALAPHRLVELRHSALGRASAWAILIAGAAYLWWASRQAVVEALAGGAFLYLALDPRPYPGSVWLRRITPLAYGVYLAHLMLLKIAESAVQRLGWGPSAGLDLSLFVLVAWGSLTLSWLLSRSARTRWLIG